jgi:hypothetical protein
LSEDQPHQGPGPNADDFDPKQHLWDGELWWTADRQYWWGGSTWQSVDKPYQAPDFVGSLPKTRRRPGWWRDFWLGFVGVIAGNIALVILIGALGGAAYGQAGSLLALMPWVLNFGALVLFAVIRPPVALGMLLAYGIALGLVLLAGIFLAIVCFGGGGGVP